jgi:hypothetical protein
MLNILSLLAVAVAAERHRGAVVLEDTGQT